LSCWFWPAWLTGTLTLALVDSVTYVANYSAFPSKKLKKKSAKLSALYFIAQATATTVKTTTLSSYGTSWTPN